MQLVDDFDQIPVLFKWNPKECARGTADDFGVERIDRTLADDDSRRVEPEAGAEDGTEIAGILNGIDERQNAAALFVVRFGAGGAANGDNALRGHCRREALQLFFADNVNVHFCRAGLFDSGLQIGKRFVGFFTQGI